MLKYSTTIKNILVLLITACVFLSATAFAAKPIYSGGKERAAIRGYDPVAYFTNNEPVKGSKEFVYKYKGAKWLFANQQNLDAFKANPDKYSPQYGGYCAYAVSRGSTASIKPQYFTIHDGKLYLNYSSSVFKKWMKDKKGYISAADKKWPKVLEK